MAAIGSLRRGEVPYRRWISAKNIYWRLQ